MKPWGKPIKYSPMGQWVRKSFYFFKKECEINPQLLPPVWAPDRGNEQTSEGKQAEEQCQKEGCQFWFPWGNRRFGGSHHCLLWLPRSRRLWAWSVHSPKRVGRIADVSQQAARVRIHIFNALLFFVLLTLWNERTSKASETVIFHPNAFLNICFN